MSLSNIIRVKSVPLNEEELKSSYCLLIGQISKFQLLAGSVIWFVCLRIKVTSVLSDYFLPLKTSMMEKKCAINVEKLLICPLCSKNITKMCILSLQSTGLVKHVDMNVKQQEFHFKHTCYKSIQIPQGFHVKFAIILAHLSEINMFISR